MVRVMDWTSSDVIVHSSFSVACACLCCVVSVVVVLLCHVNRAGRCDSNGVPTHPTANEVRGATLHCGWLGTVAAAVCGVWGVGVVPCFLCLLALLLSRLSHITLTTADSSPLMQWTRITWTSWTPSFSFRVRVHRSRHPTFLHFIARPHNQRARRSPRVELLSCCPTRPLH